MALLMPQNSAPSSPATQRTASPAESSGTKLQVAA
jgi:hypothetical protein